MKRFLGLTTLLLLLGAGVAQAQVTYTVTTVPTFVIESGMSEVLGGVRVTASSPGATSVASTIDYFFSTPCDNSTTDGMTLKLDGTVFTAVNTQIQTSGIANEASGCVVPVTVAGGIVIPTPVAGYIELDGVRGRVFLTSSVAGSIITATLTATPSNSSFFTVPNVGNVAYAEPGYTETITPGVVLQCVGTASPEPVLTITEGFNAAFVDNGLSAMDGDVPPANARNSYSATNNTQIHIALSSIPTGMTFTWPLAVYSQITGGFAAGVSGSALVLNTALTTATDIYYDYVCGNQAVCDLTTEVFKITSNTFLTDSTTNYGTGDAQTQLWPHLTPDVTVLTTPPNALGDLAKPRFQDGLIPVPPAMFASNEPCHTVLLYPWAVYYPSLGYDTGIVIANTSTDPFGALGAGGTQQGTCLLNGYMTATPSAPSAPTASTPYTTPNIPSGATWASPLSQIPAFNAANFEGYIIAVCNFQYGHGSAQISDFLTTNSGVVYGYTALLIPDPYIVGHRYPWWVGQPVPNSGEGLTE